MAKKIWTLILLVLPLFAYNQGINQTDKNGMKQGIWIKKFPNGAIRYKGRFVNDYPVGKMEHFDESGGLKAVLIFSQKGQKAKAEIYHNSSSPVAKGNFINREKDSIWVYFDNTNVIRAKETYIQGVKNGISEYRFANGNLSESVNFVNGKKHGLWKRFFENGKPLLEAMYENGKLHGGIQAYHPNGIIEFGGSYHLGRKTGNWEYFSEKGVLLFAVEYENGVALNQNQLEALQQENLKQMEIRSKKLIDSDPQNYIDDPDSFLRSQMKR